MNYMLIDPTTGTIIQLDVDTFIVPLTDDELAQCTDEKGKLFEAPDMHQLTVIPVIETIEFKEI